MPTPFITVSLFPNDQYRSFDIGTSIPSEKFYQIEGVAHVHLHDSTAGITISEEVDWNGIEPRIIDIIKKHMLWVDVEIHTRDLRKSSYPFPHTTGYRDGSR